MEDGIEVAPMKYPDVTVAKKWFVAPGQHVFAAAFRMSQLWHLQNLTAYQDVDAGYNQRVRICLD